MKGQCDSLNAIHPLEALGNGTIGKCGIVGVGLALLQEMS